MPMSTFHRSSLSVVIALALAGAPHALIADAATDARAQAKAGKLLEPGP
jgi:ABC-type dipeptide/oligopeptide/nickel transport system ATPase component